MGNVLLTFLTSPKTCFFRSEIIFIPSTPTVHKGAAFPNDGIVVESALIGVTQSSVCWSQTPGRTVKF